ncbi:MAG TPA: biotin/lipoyl-containing protein [Burkholderiales bacterium]|jgi:biotin carboxyl carrier protein|nr:biotin/lipoyl-containing protein [Burkholderiales bacterium]
MPDLTFRDVLSILRLIDSTPFQDMQLEFEGTRLKVTRRAVAQPAERAVTPLVSASPARPSPAEFADGVEVKPPMAGTYYAAPSPGARAFVEVDRAVRKGDQLGIVEVMKLFTPVLSPCDGIVRAILVKNEEFVESEQTLMVIEERR